MQNKKGFELNVWQIILFVYLFGVAFFLARFIWNILILFRQKRVAEKLKYKGQELVLLDYRANPFCFLKTIYISKEDYVNKTIDDTLLTHEVSHIKQLHSFDVVFIEIVQIFYWFNPLLILYSKAMKINHEFLADDHALKDGGDLKTYSFKLLSFIDYKRNLSIASSFNRSLTKKRLIMITKSKSGEFGAGLRIASILGLVVVLFLTICCVQSKTQSPEMIFVPQGQFKTTLFRESDTISDLTVNVDAFLMSNEISNREYREFTDWCKANPGETLYKTKWNRKEIFDSLNGKTYRMVIPILNPIEISDILNNLIDSSSLYRIDKRYKDYFTNKKYDDYPVVGVSGRMAEYYCIWRTFMEIKHIKVGDNTIAYGPAYSYNYRLPLEFEWEYVAQQPYKTKVTVSNVIKKVNDGTKNVWDLFHMNDNVSEWVVSDALKGGIIRGGSWKNNPDYHYRKTTDLDYRDGTVGFRVVKSYMPEGTSNIQGVKDQPSADFSGNWELNYKESPVPGTVKTTLNINKLNSEDNSIMIDRMIYFDGGKKPLRNQRICYMSGQEVVTRSKYQTQTVISRWSPDRQSFSITTSLLTQRDTIKREATRVETFKLTDGGRKLIINFNDDMPSNSSNWNMVFDKVINN